MIPSKCNVVVIVGLKILVDLFDVLCTLVVYITYNIGKRDLPDIYTLALGPVALMLRHIYQATPSCPCYNYYITDSKHNTVMSLTYIHDL